MTGNNGPPPPISPPVIAHYSTIYADLITPLVVMMSDDYQEHWIYDVDADDVTQADLSGMERRIPALEQELKEVQKVSNDVTIFGKKWMDEAAKHPQTARDEEVDKYEQLCTHHDVPALIGRAVERVRELRQSIKKMTRLYDKCHATFERQSGTVGVRPRTVFPLGATSSGTTRRRPGASSINTSSSSTVAEEHGLKYAGVNEPSSDSEGSVHSIETAEQASQVDDVKAELQFSDASYDSGCYSSVPRKNSPHSTSVLRLSAMLREIQNELDAALHDTHSSQETLAQAIQDTKKLTDFVRSAPANPITYASAYAFADVSGQYPGKNRGSSCPSEDIQASAFECKLMVASQADYPASYAASVRQLYAMLAELEEVSVESPMACSEITKLEMEQVILLLKHANDRVSAAATRWVGDAAAINRYQAACQVLQMLRKELSVVSLQRRASARLQELRRICRKDEHVRREPLRYNPRVHEQIAQRHMCCVGRMQTWTSDPPMSVLKQDNAMQTQHFATNCSTKRGISLNTTEHVNLAADQRTSDDQWWDGSSTYSHRQAQKDAAAVFS